MKLKSRGITLACWSLALALSAIATAVSFACSLASVVWVSMLVFFVCLCAVLNILLSAKFANHGFDGDDPFFEKDPWDN